MKNEHFTNKIISDRLSNPGSFARARRNKYISNQRTTLSVEGIFWEALEAIAEEEGVRVDDIIFQLEISRASDMSRASAIRIFVLSYFMDRDAA